MAAYQYNPYPVNNRNNNNEQDQVAIFIDWDNLVISNYADRGSNRPDLEVLIRRAQQYGTIVIARAYAEWNVTADRLEVYKAGIEPIYAPVFHADRDLSGQTTRGKSLADPVMVTDCIDFLHLLPQIGTYVLVTGDKDMVPVVRLARLRGRRVVIIGPDYVANVLQQVSDEFIPYRYLLAQVQAVADPYAPYYQQQPGSAPAQPYFPGQIPAQPVQPPQVQPTQTGTDRRGRRLTGNRRNQASYTPAAPQPYARITPPPPNAQTATPQLNPYGYYGQPGQVPPGYPQPELYQQPQVAQPPYTYPQATGYQAVPVTTPAPAAPAQPIVTPAPQPAQVFTSPAAAPSTYRPAPVPVPSVPATPPASAASPVVETASADVSAQASSGKTGTSDFSEVKDVIQAILAQRVSSGRNQMRARDLKEELLRRIPNFSERRYGFSKFKALLNAAEAAGVLQIDQSGHILWVSAPGTPKMQFGAGGAGTEETAQAADADFEEESEGDDEATNPAAEAELASQPGEAAVAAHDAFQTGQTVEPQEATYARPVGAEGLETTMAEPATEVIVPEERTTSLVGSATPEETPVRTELNRAESVLGPRPSQLNQPFYQDVIVLIDHLRTRNRWLGYELLLSNVRDLLSREMPESEAKIQAGNILSHLLSDGIIKMAIEVHSRGARKMTVKVAHLQDETPAVRYALESFKLQSEAQAAEPEGDQSLAEQVEPQQAATSVEGQTRLQEAGQEAATEGEQSPVSQSESADHGEGLSEPWGGYYTQQAHPAEADAALAAATEAPAVEAGGEAGELGQEAATVAPGEMPQDATAEQPEGDQPQDQGNENPELSGQAVEAPVVEEPGATADTGENVQGEPETAPQGEEGAPAGGYINTAEMSQGETPQEYTPGQSFEENPPAGQSQGQPESQSADHSAYHSADQSDAPASEGGYFAADAGQSLEQSADQSDGGQQAQGEVGQPTQGESPFDEVPSYGDPPLGNQFQGQPENYQPESQDGYQSQLPVEPDQDGKQVPAEVLQQPVVELDGDEAEEGEEVEEEAEGDTQAPKPVRRPRRRRAPRVVAAPEGEQSPGQGESMGQPAERRAPLHHHARPHRRPHTR
jgi:uncharacterized LabA/DUF88 family protein